MSFEAYHGVTGAEHRRASTASSAGTAIRMISLSVYGEPGAARYAAVWVQRSGPGWVAVHGVDAAGYQPFSTTWTAKGYAPVLVSATGTAQQGDLRGSVRAGHQRAWEARHGH